MHRLAAFAVVTALTPGCITGYGLYKHQQDVSTVNIIEAAVVDVAAMTFFMYSAEAFSIASAFVTGVATTGVDLGVACLLGTCQALHP